MNGEQLKEAGVKSGSYPLLSGNRGMRKIYITDLDGRPLSKLSRPRRLASAALHKEAKVRTKLRVVNHADWTNAAAASILSIAQRL